MCTGIDDEWGCMQQPGCGWAQFKTKDSSDSIGYDFKTEGRCISGTPDHPCEPTATVVQWEPPTMCYMASYNDKCNVPETVRQCVKPRSKSARLRVAPEAFGPLSVPLKA